MQTVYIHLGLPKTATSYLQVNFARSAAQYQKHGLAYPDLDRNFVTACSGDTTSGNGVSLAANDIESLRIKFTPLDVYQFRDNLDPAFSHLISSEWLSRCSSEFLLDLVRLLGSRFSVIFLASVRDPCDRIVSSYLQKLKVGTITQRFEQQISNLVNEERRVCQLLVSLSDHLKLFNYDVEKEKIIHRYEQYMLGYTLAELSSVSVVNPSPNVWEAEMLLLANRLGIGDFQKAQDFLNGKYGISQSMPRFDMRQNMRARIYDELAGEMELINSLLAPDERIGQRCDKTDSVNLGPSFSEVDIDFLKSLIDMHKYSLGGGQSFSRNDLDFIRLSVENFKDCPELPEDFDPWGYLIFNPDVLAARVDPVIHYLAYGKNELRKWHV